MPRLRFGVAGENAYPQAFFYGVEFPREREYSWGMSHEKPEDDNVLEFKQPPKREGLGARLDELSRVIDYVGDTQDSNNKIDALATFETGVQALISEGLFGSEEEILDTIQSRGNKTARGVIILARAIRG